MKALLGVLLTLATATASDSAKAALVSPFHPDQKVYFDPITVAGVRPQDVTFSSKNGARLHGWYFTNKSGSSPKAILVQFHGNAENVTSHFAALAWVLDHGYDFFIFDYQGFGKSEGKPTVDGAVEDGVAAVRLMSQRAPGRPIVLIGQSIGGILSVKVTSLLKSEVPIAGVVVDSSFASFVDMGQKMVPSMPRWSVKLAAPSDAPFENAPAEVSPVPAIVMHAEDDSVVPFSFGQALFSKMKEPKEFWTIPRGGHIRSLVIPEIQVRLMGRLSEILSPNQGGEPPSPTAPPVPESSN